VYIDFKLENSNNSSLTEPKLAVFQIFRPASKGGTLQVKRKLQKEEEEEEEEEEREGRREAAGHGTCNESRGTIFCIILRHCFPITAM
jgi:hypothetical protein